MIETANRESSKVVKYPQQWPPAKLMEYFGKHAQVPTKLHSLNLKGDSEWYVTSIKAKNLVKERFELIAMSNEMPIGRCAGNLVNVNSELSIEIDVVYVLPSLREKGIGSMLRSAVCEEVKAFIDSLMQSSKEQRELNIVLTADLCTKEGELWIEALNEDLQGTLDELEFLWYPDQLFIAQYQNCACW